MRCKQQRSCAFLQYLRHITSKHPSSNSHAPPDGLRSAPRPAILSVPVSRELLGGRADEQDQQYYDGSALARHRGLDRLDSLRRVHRWNNRLHRRNTSPSRTRTFRGRPRPQRDTRSHILRSWDRNHDIRILLRPSLRCRVWARNLNRGSVRHRIRNRRSNLRTLRSTTHILPAEKQRSHAALDSLRNFHLPRFDQLVPPPVR